MNTRDEDTTDSDIFPQPDSDDFDNWDEEDFYE